MYPDLTLSSLPTPKPSAVGRSKITLVERRIAVMEACNALLKALEAALPEDCDYDPPSRDTGDMARRAWRERMSLIEALQDEITTEAMKITIDWNPNS